MYVNVVDHMSCGLWSTYVCTWYNLLSLWKPLKHSKNLDMNLLENATVEYSESIVDKVWRKFVRSTRKVNEYEKNEDVLTTEESESRLICLEIVLATISSLLASSFAILYWKQNSNHIQLMYAPPYVPKDEMINATVIQNLVLVYDNGTLLQVYFGKNLEMSNFKKILQLPSANDYFTMTYKSRLSIAYSHATRKMTQYHPNLNENGHITVPNSGIDPTFDNWKDCLAVDAVQVGSKLWLLGQKPKYHINANFHFKFYRPESNIWYQRRQKWRNGPNLPAEFFHHYLCSSALNSSAVLLIGGKDYDPSQRLVFVYDFQSSSWFQYPSIVDKDGFMWYCTATLVSDKFTSRYIRGFENLFAYLSKFLY